MAAKRDKKITTKDVCQLLGREPMTVFNYRKGVGKQLKSPLPFHLESRGSDRHSVFYKLSEVLHWAKINGLTVDLSAVK